VKFLLDVCVSSRSLQAYLAGQGHDVLSALAVDPRASDERLLAIALQDDRVLLTEDRDFGELIFVRRLHTDQSFAWLN
jgi:predicted nuclease of predicted toxin-antitoxin system